MNTLLLIILILLLLGALPVSYGMGWGPYPGGGVFVILLTVLIYMLTRERP